MAQPRSCLSLASLFVALCACGGDDFADGAGGAGAAGGSGAAGGAVGQGGGSAGAGAGAEGGGGTGGSGTGGSGGAGHTLTLQSFALTEGGTFGDTFTCAGDNASLPLDWLPANAVTQSYAIVFSDESNDVRHWVIWDIPTAVLALAGNIPQLPTPPMPSGAKQAKSYDGMTHGYLGPCPDGVEHVYEFVLHAVDVAALPGVTTDSSMAQVEAAIGSHTLATGSLTGKSSASPP